MIIKPYFRIFLTGKTQSGKSYFCKNALLPRYKNYIIYDIKGEYKEFGAVVHNLEELKKAILIHNCNKIVLIPTDITPEAFDLVCEFIYNRLKNIVFVVDEVQEYVKKLYIPPNFSKIIKVGQGDKLIGVVSMSQRPQEVHNTIISQASIRISFKIDIIQDCKAVCGFMNVEPDELRNLPYYSFFIYYDLNTETPLVMHSPI